MGECISVSFSSCKWHKENGWGMMSFSKTKPTEVVGCGVQRVLGCVGWDVGCVCPGTAFVGACAEVWASGVGPVRGCVGTQAPEIWGGSVSRS